MTLGKCTACDQRLSAEETTGWDVMCPACAKEHHDGYIANLKRERAMLLDVLRQHLNAWEDEEDSVQEEHAELISELRALLTKVTEA